MPYKWWKTLLLAGLYYWAGCGSPPQPPKGALRIALFSPYTSLDPIYTRDQVSVWLVQQIFSGLVHYDENLSPAPALAYKWEISPDGKKYRFYLRRGVPYQGRPQRFLKAQDVVYSWHRLAHPRHASPGGYLFRGIIRGWAAYQSGEAPTIAGLTALSDSLLEVELETPYAPFLHLLTLPYAAVVLPEAAESLGKDFGQYPVGCGPFAVEYHEVGRLLVLSRWQPAPNPAAQKLIFRWLPNRLWAWEALRRGEIDAFEGSDRALTYLLQKDSTWHAYAYQIETPQIGTEYLGLRVDKNSPVADRALRRSLRTLIARLPLTEVLFQGHATPARTFLPPPLLLYVPPLDTAPLTPEALARLRQLSLTLYAAPTFRELCEYLRQAFEAAGLPLQVEYLLGPSLREFLSKGQIALWKASWLADFPDGENFLILFESAQKMPAGPNTTLFSHPLMDSLITEARRTLDEKARKKLYTRAESLLQAEAPVIPLYHAHGIWTVSQRVRAFPKSPLPVWLPLDGVEISD